ncbi:MAG: hypothetical protein WBP59_02635 [Ilumatobacteraceae bacterium]
MTLLAAAACSGDDSEGGTSGDEPAAATASPDGPTAGDPAGTPVDETVPVDGTSTDANGDDDTSDHVSVDALAPGEAIVVVDGQTLRFAAGDSIFDVCEMSPDFELGDAQLDAVGFPPDGGPHLRVGIGIEPKYVVIGIPPDTAYVAGAGEEIDPYIEQFGISPQPVTLEAGDGFAVGTVDFTDPFTGEVIIGEVAVRCE